MIGGTKSLLSILETQKFFDMNIINKFLPESQYLPDVRKGSELKQVVLHHTCGSTAESALSWWKTTPERVGTNYIIDSNGTVIVAIPINRYAFHIAIGSFANKRVVKQQYRSINHERFIARQSIGIELVSLGELTAKGDILYDCYNSQYCNISDTDKYVKYENGFRGNRYYTRYTDEQLQALKEVLQDFKDYKLPIEFTYKPEMWDLCENAIKGESGIWAHVSYRIDKSDCHPQPELVELLKSLK